MARWVVVPDDMFGGWWTLSDEDIEGTLASVIDWYGIAHKDKDEAQFYADMLNGQTS